MLGYRKGVGSTYKAKTSPCIGLSGTDIPCTEQGQERRKEGHPKGRGKMDEAVDMHHDDAAGVVVNGKQLSEMIPSGR